MAPKKVMTKSPQRQVTKHHLRDEDVMLLWKLVKLNRKKVGIAALSKELNLEVAAVHMRWSWLNAKFEAFQKKVNEKETTAAAASSADTTMKDIDDSEDTKEAEETEEAKGGNNDEDAE
ncbi:hypothetical protein LT330_004411 [Penicillium expansum]|nr:hypothetical protein LT330_004411 [Penicillium expansum]